MELLYVLFMYFNVPIPVLRQFVFNCISGHSKGTWSLRSSLKRFGRHFDHFRKFFSLIQAAICLHTEGRAHSSKKTKEAATQHSMLVWRAYSSRDGHAANMQAHGVCLLRPKSHAASMVPVWLSWHCWCVLVKSHVALIHPLQSLHDPKLWKNEVSAWEKILGLHSTPY